MWSRRDTRGVGLIIARDVVMVFSVLRFLTVSSVLEMPALWCAFDEVHEFEQ